MGIHRGDRHLYAFLFAMFQGFIDKDEDSANYLIKKLMKEYIYWGLEMITERTQYMIYNAKYFHSIL